MQISWQLTPCKNNLLKAYWPNPNGFDIPMLYSGEDLIETTPGPNNTIHKITIPLLNHDGSGVFIKLAYASSPEYLTH